GLSESAHSTPSVIACALAFPVRVVERALEDCQHPVCRRAAPSHLLRAAVVLPMLLRAAGLGAQPRWRLGDFLMPRHNASFVELGQLKFAELRCDPCFCRPIKPINRLAAPAQIIGPVIGERIGDGIRPTGWGEVPSLFPGLVIEPCARALL